MLETLKNYNSQVIQQTLADVSTFFLPSTAEQEAQALSRVSIELKQKVISEIRGNLGLQADDNSPKALNRIHRLLLSEMTKSVLSDADEAEIRERLGQKGDLSPNLYQVKFSDASSYFIKTGISRVVAESVVKNPDYFQHLHPDENGLNPENSTSLFTKMFIGGEIQNNHTLIVVAQRQGFVQLIQEAWILYHVDVDITQAKTPLDMLKLFVQKYGENMMVAGKEGSFFWEEKIPIVFGKPSDIMRIPNTDKHNDWIACTQIKENDGFVEIGHAYSINLTKYKADLRKHNFRKNKK